MIDEFYEAQENPRETEKVEMTLEIFVIGLVMGQVVGFTVSILLWFGLQN